MLPSKLRPESPVKSRMGSEFISLEMRSSKPETPSIKESEIELPFLLAVAVEEETLLRSRVRKLSPKPSTVVLLARSDCRVVSTTSKKTSFWPLMRLISR